MGYILLKLPPVAQLNSTLPQEAYTQLEAYYREIPTYLHEVATHYRARRKDVQAIKEEMSVEPENTLAIILGFASPSEDGRGNRLSVDTFNRIKHQFFVTGKLATYQDPTDSRVLEYAALQLDQAFSDNVIHGVISIARIMSDFASILLLLDSQGASV